MSITSIRDFRIRFAIKAARYLRQSLTDPRWLFVFFFSRFYTIRVLFAGLARRPKIDSSRRGDSLFETVDIEPSIRALEQNGFVPGFVLPCDIVDKICDFAEGAEAIANDDPTNRFRLSERSALEQRLGESIVTASYEDVGERCDPIRQIMSDPKLEEIAARYLRARPDVSCRMWWNFPSDQRNDDLKFARGVFHYDPDVAFRALKLFFYLTDVNESNGPHVCVLGSHRRKRLKHLLTFLIGQEDNEIIDFYGEANVCTMCERAGYGFAEDPMCFHKGNPPTNNPRLMLEVVFVGKRH